MMVEKEKELEQMRLEKKALEEKLKTSKQVGKAEGGCCTTCIIF